VQISALPTIELSGPLSFGEIFSLNSTVKSPLNHHRKLRFPQFPEKIQSTLSKASSSNRHRCRKPALASLRRMRRFATLAGQPTPAISKSIVRINSKGSTIDLTCTIPLGPDESPELIFWYHTDELISEKTSWIVQLYL
jgi:hypothetical protein